ncbi:hypothetical protein OE749_05275 [Aestuariibacter sp. AA17]|uniref:Type VI secretion system contractile sheath large subunit n=1 Tax=Fluctibacter corallii TaxID=2984329 RepID=A0ABT3A5Y2_9ALTE|nr:hypothetical protein [Aestuariibacter sp. AA17]MCV2884096.1 hypothetical protein [Aestuariibacter sp. AA17]
MPSTIPFDPSLVLGNVVDQSKIDDLTKIAELQKPVDAAQQALNSYILSKRSLDMTLQEMINMNVDQSDLDNLAKEIDTVKSDMSKAAVALAQETVKALPEIRAARESMSQKQISSTVESPMDYNKSDIKKMPLSSDSMVMDAQYFRFESNTDSSDAHSSSIAAYVSSQVSAFLSPTYSAEVGSSAKKVMESQHSNHSIEGTLVITANCTHKVADLFAPFVLDPEKAIRAWNVYVPDKKIDTADPESMQKVIAGKDSDSAGMYLLSGATYGSSFVGMVHILQDEKSDSSQSSSSVAASMSASIEEHLFLANSSGKFGLDTSFANSLKNLLSTSNLQSHASFVAMGIIPSIKSNAIKTTVQTLKPDPKEVMSQLAAIQGANDGTVNTMGSSAEKAKAGESFMQLDNSYVTNVVSSLGEYDNANNQVIDTNSMMTALDDYISKAIEGDCGVPINFFLKPLTSRQLAEAWLYKFYPGEYVGESSGDDESKGPTPKTDS